MSPMKDIATKFSAKGERIMILNAASGLPVLPFSSSAAAIHCRRELPTASTARSSFFHLSDAKRWQLGCNRAMHNARICPDATMTTSAHRIKVKNTTHSDARNTRSSFVCWLYTLYITRACR